MVTFKHTVCILVCTSVYFCQKNTKKLSSSIIRQIWKYETGGVGLISKLVSNTEEPLIFFVKCAFLLWCYKSYQHVDMWHIVTQLWQNLSWSRNRVLYSCWGWMWYWCFFEQILCQNRTNILMDFDRNNFVGNDEDDIVDIMTMMMMMT